jgi:anthranilate synthase component 2
MNVLVIDNYDSFTWNLVQYLQILDAEVEVHRNDRISVTEISEKAPDRLLISPGPCDPDRAGISMAAIRAFSGQIPLLGVCLGHQSIGQVFGGKVIRAQRLMHGKTSAIHHTGQGVFSELPSPFRATRYHSLALCKAALPDCLAVTAWTDDGEIMGIRHKTLAVQGVQFHPESILSEWGMELMKNFLDGSK